MSDDISTLGIAVDSSQVKRGSQDLDGLAAAGARAEKSTASVTSASSRLASALGLVAGAFASIGISRFVAETASLNQRYQELGIVLGVVAKNAGYTRSEVDAVTESIKNQGISMIESRSVVTRLIQAQIDLSKATQLARLAQDAAVIGQINSSEALDRMIHGITSAQVEVLRGIGINVNFEQSYKNMAKEIGVSTSSLSEHQKMQARTNVVIAEADKLNGVYAASMENAGKQMRSTQRLAEDLKVKVGGLFDQTAMIAVKGYTDLLKDLDIAIDDIAKSGELKDWSHRIAIEFAGLMDLTRVFIGQFGILGNLIATQFTNIKNGDFDKVTTGFANADKALIALYENGEKYQDQVNSRVIQESMIAPITERQAIANKKNASELDLINRRTEEGAVLTKKYADPLKVLREEQDRLKGLLDAGAISQQIYNKALKEAQDQYAKPQIKVHSDAVKELNKTQQASIRIEAEYIKLLQIEKKQRDDLIKPYQDSAKQAESRVEDMQDEISAMMLVRDEQISLQSAVQKTAIAKLEEKKISAIDSGIVDQIDAEISARRKLLNMIPDQERLSRETQRTANEVTELFRQAGRNIQSTLANSIFNFFDDGLKGMVKNVTSAVGRIASEFAALKIAQGIGLAGLFGSGAASAGSIGGAGSGFLNVSSLGLNATSLFKSGFGATDLIGGLGSNLPGTAGSFFSGFGVGGTEAAAQAGASALWGASGASTAASMGTSFAAAAGPLIALAAVDAIGRVFGGDKKLGGAEMIPVIGGFLAGLFGHGPMKFRQQSLQGTASSDGFDGDITNVFRAKGGLFVKNKHKPVSEQFSLEQQTLFDTALSGFYGSAHNFAENLGLSTDLVDNFTAQVQIKSEKGKTLTEDAITDMLKGIGNSLAQNVLPMVDTLRKAGEDSFATMTRLNNEFVALTQGAENLGASVGYAKEIIRGMTFEARTAFIDAAGGIDSLSAKTQFFADNFLTAAERLAPASQRLAESMQALGLSSDITKEQFKALVQSYGQLNSITENQLQGLLSLAPAFVAIKNAQEQLTGTTNKVAESERSLNDVRQELLSSYNKERGELESTISKFKSVSDSLRSFRDSLSLGQLSPLTPGQKLEEARAQFNRTRLAAAQGDQSALESLSGVSQEFLQASQTYNASSAAFISDFNLVKGVLDNASQSALSQSEIARNQLTALDKSVDYLVDIQTNTKTTADLIREINIKSLTGSGNAAISTKDIQGFLSANPNLTAQQIANAATKYGVSGQQLIDAGVDRGAVDLFIKGSSITDKQILDFVNSGASPRQIYDAAVANGITSKRLSKVSGISMMDIEKFVHDNNLPSFAKGTDFVAKTGLAMVHRAEAIVPSSTTEEIKKLREELAKLRQEQNQQTGDLIKVTDITSKQNADTIAEAITVIDKNRQWNDRAMVRLA